MENEELKKRVEEFNVELKALLAKYHLGLGAVAQILPSAVICDTAHSPKYHLGLWAVAQITADGRIAAVPKLQEAVDPLPEPKVA